MIRPAEETLTFEDFVHQVHRIDVQRAAGWALLIATCFGVWTLVGIALVWVLS